MLEKNTRNVCSDKIRNKRNKRPVAKALALRGGCPEGDSYDLRFVMMSGFWCEVDGVVVVAAAWALILPIFPSHMMKNDSFVYSGVGGGWL